MEKNKMMKVFVGLIFILSVFMVSCSGSKEKEIDKLIDQMESISTEIMEAASTLDLQKAMKLQEKAEKIQKDFEKYSEEDFTEAQIKRLEAIGNSFM
jgi:Rps23 Pro-64 3,4-dihydroxylase Tpa1-like proline 4-hydroxylase